LCAVCFGFIITFWGGWRWIEDRRYRSEIALAEKDMAGGRHRQARQRLADLTRRHPLASEAAYDLGECEDRLGHPEAALSAWSSVLPDSPLYAKAAVARAWVLIHSGRLGPAEETLRALRHLDSTEAAQVLQVHEHLLRLEGRTNEARDLIFASWRGAPDPAAVLKRLYILEDSSFPLDYVKDVLKKGDPGDDRVWLGRANVSIWQGRLAEAASWLDACEKRRPDDQAVWLARLSLAMASGDPSGARRAVGHLDGYWFLPFEVLRLRAWFAGSRGDAEAERRTLLALVDDQPGNTAALARLGELDQQAGRLPEAEAFRRKLGEAIRLRERYTELLMRDEPARHVDELGRLARDLGRGVEARGWALIQQGRAAHERLWPVPLGKTPAPPPRRALSSLIGDLSPAVDIASSPPAGVASILPAFTDDAQQAGLRFFHDNGHTSAPPPPTEAMCGGIGVLDYDGDGWYDVYAVQSGHFPPADSARQDGDRLFRNRGDGTFEDVTVRSGIAAFRQGYGHGVAVADFDNDGRPDLFVTRWRSYALYRNRGDGTFEDLTDRVGLGGDRDWPTSAVFADLDGDGDLDLYVCHYLLFDPAHPLHCNRSDAQGFCMPRDYPSLPDHVFRNDNGRFVEVTAEAGFVDPDGRGLGVVAANLDDDNKIDLYVANDMSANYLFRNLGGFRFEETGQSSGSAASADGLYKSGMGIACGDLDGDLTLDLAVTNFFSESTTFFRNLGPALFVDHTAIIGLQAPSRPLLGFGAAFLDANNDGRLDFLSTNGHVQDLRPRIPWTMPLQLLVGGPNGRLTDVSDRAGPPFRETHLGRGLAIGDFDNDGRIDALVLNQNQPLAYLRNRTERADHYVTFRLEGTSSNRDAVGARVTVTSGGRRRLGERIGGGSYQSASDPRVHFGLGDSRSIETVEVRWPSGRVDRHGRLEANREYRLREGDRPHEVKHAGSTTIPRRAGRG
jgi:predicted Zn-dependent protease